MVTCLERYLCVCYIAEYVGFVQGALNSCLISGHKLIVFDLQKKERRVPARPSILFDR